MRIKGVGRRGKRGEERTVISMPQFAVSVHLDMRTDTRLRGEDGAAEGGAVDFLGGVADYAEHEGRGMDVVVPAFD